MKIGVFDSGVGGLSVAKAIEEAFPKDNIVFMNDPQNVPYGTKTKAELIKLVLPILIKMTTDGCDVIVIVCNTVTTTLIDQLRSEITVPLIGMEPMVKPACEYTKSNKIAVLATPSTLSSDRYQWLKKSYAKNIEVIEPDCSDWAKMIEESKIDQEKISMITNDVCSKGVDVIVLGCTHYHWIENRIKTGSNGRAKVIQPEKPVIKQLQRVMQGFGH